MSTRTEYRLRCAVERKLRLEAQLRQVEDEIAPLEAVFRKERGFLCRLHPGALRKELGL